VRAEFSWYSMVKTGVVDTETRRAKISPKIDEIFCFSRDVFSPWRLLRELGIQ
jgi:hypothetical protein